MKEKVIASKILIKSYDELNTVERELVEMALDATRNSYAPYSNFHVGAALRLESGELIKGANQENAAFPAGICAERSAIFNAGANHPGVPITHLAVAARGTDGEIVAEPCAPCGVCRQAILEFETHSDRPIQMLLVGRNEVYITDSIKDLLPLCFSEF